MCWDLVWLWPSPGLHCQPALGRHPCPHLAPRLPLCLQTLCEQLRKENEALKAKLDKGLEQRDQAAERLR